MAERYDVVVVGAGPAGCVAALTAARLGCGPTVGSGRVLLLERRPSPRGHVCAGGLSPRACRLLDELGLWRRVQREAYPIHCARIVSPSGREAVVRGAVVGAVLDRGRFDALLIEAASGAGAELRTGVRVDEVLAGDDRAPAVRCGGDVIEARWVVAATGGWSRLVPRSRAFEPLHTCMARYEGVRAEPNQIDLIYDAELLPHYGWLFPESGSRANVGIALSAGRLARRPLRAAFEAFVSSRLRRRLAGAERVGPLRGRTLATSHEVSHHAPPGVLVAGEAAGLVDSATGEGIYCAMASGRMAAETVRLALTRGLHPRDAERLYRARLHGSFSRSFTLAGVYGKALPRGFGLLSLLAGSSVGRRAVGRLLAEL